MELIVMSLPDMFAEEESTIHALFEAEMGCFHLRKPAASYEALEKLISRMPTAYQGKMVLHQHYSLAFQYKLRGIHLPEQVRKDIDTRSWLDLLDKVDRQGMTLSTAIHTRQALREVPPLFDYVLMSPVFSSISKPGHAPQEDMNISDIHCIPKIFALGGIDAQNIGQLSNMGYQGAALLGAIWQNPYAAADHFIDIKKAIL